MLYICDNLHFGVFVWSMSILATCGIYKATDSKV